MNNKVVSIREMQRNYRSLINRAKQTRQPIYLGARLQKEAVLMDAESFQQLQFQADRIGENWPAVKKTLAWIRSGQSKKINLGKFIHADRQTH